MLLFFYNQHCTFKTLVSITVVITFNTILGWNDVGFHNKLIKTPNLNWLARNGIELTDNHAQPLCSP